MTSAAPRLSQPGVLVGLAGAGHHLVAAPGEQDDGEGPHATRRPGHQDGSVPGAQAPLLELVEAEGGGEAGGADGHGLARREPVGDREGTARRDPRVAGVAAVAGDAEVATVGEDLGPGLELGVGARHHHSGQVHPGHQW